ncbi:MAG: hypothetical protein GEU71_11740 [Actinobacteria bacterium]|nr:hypothetical protein [Actinomycetota bacterium]
MTAWLSFEWSEAGLTWFARSTTPANPWVWIVTGLAIYYSLYQLPSTGFGAAWGRRVAVVFGAVVAATAVFTLLGNGELWAAPLTWLLYGLATGFLILVTISFVIAVILGTPGCEIGGLAELIRRLRGDTGAEAMWCIVGLHRIDEWEAGRRRTRQ